METEYLGNAYTTQSSNDGCVAVACPIDAGCAINACGTAACGANACPADICVTAGCVANVCINACTIVFDDTIRYNIYLDSVHNDTVIGNKLISILHLRGLFDKLEKGVDTPIDNRFITLSGGEKQKITLMRALVHNPSIILLDEPTSALDKDSIDDLKKYLTSIKKNRIIIISTHDKNIVDLADVTINLDKGHIFEAEVL